MSDFDDFFNSLGNIIASSGSDLHRGNTSCNTANNSPSISGIFGELVRLLSEPAKLYLSYKEYQLHKQQIILQLQSLETERLSIATTRQNTLDQIAANFLLEKEREKYSRDLAKESVEYQRLLDRHPLSILITPTLEFYQQFEQGEFENGKPVIPPLVLISPPALEFDNATEWFAAIESDLTDRLRDFLAKNYPIEDKLRPSKFVNAIKTKMIAQESAVEMLYWTHKSVPTIFLESKLNSDNLRIYLGHWEKMENFSHYKKIVEFSIKDILYPLARANARLWQEDREKLQQLGKTEKELEIIGGTNEINLKILLEEEGQYQKIPNQKIPSMNRPLFYKVDTVEYKEYLLNYLSICHQILIALMLDRYYILNYQVRPKLPEVLGDLLKNFPDEKFKKSLLEMVVAQYRLLYLVLEGLSPHQIPKLALDLATSLVELEDKSFFRQQVIYSVTFFLESRNCDMTEVLSAPEKLKTAFLPSDESYFEKLNNLLKLVDENLVPEVKNLLQQWVEWVEWKARQEKFKQEWTELRTRREWTELGIRKDIKITILGGIASGKTSYMLAIYNILRRGVNKFTLAHQNLDEDLGFVERWDALKFEHNWPIITFPRVSNYKFDFCFAHRPLVSFDWLDYGGGLSEHSRNEEEVKLLIDNLTESSCIFLCIPGEYLQESGKMAREHKAILARMNVLFREIVKQGKKPSVVILITKHDLCAHRTSEDIFQDSSRFFAPLFVEGGNWEVMVCPVTLGSDLAKDYNGSIEPIQIHLPLMFAIFHHASILRKETEAKLQKLKNERQLEKELFSPFSRLERLEKELSEYDSILHLLFDQLKNQEGFLIYSNGRRREV